ncbi:MAG: hypothetical protein ACOYZ6_12020 [Chloroflexota bacterium]
MTKPIINAFVVILFLLFLIIGVKESGNINDIFNPLSLFFVFILFNINLHNVKLRTVARRISATRKSSKTNEFRMEFSNSTNSVIFMVASVLLLSVSVILLISKFSWEIIIFALMPLMASILFMVLALNPQKLIFSNSGIKFQSLLLDYECEWADIFEIAGLYGRGDAIVLKNVTFKKNFLPRSFFDYKLSLSSFDTHWEKRVIGRIIKQNAPFLEFLK